MEEHKTNEKPSFLLGFFVGMSIISLVSFFVLFGLMWKLNGSDNSSASATGTTVNETGKVADSGYGQYPAPEVVQPTALTAKDHVYGNKDAKVTIIEYSDFECPYCSKNFATMEQIKKTYGDKIKISYRHFPLDFHKNAHPAAKASECAADQGKFWEMHAKIFSNQTSLATAGIFVTWAKELGLNEATFTQCFNGASKDGLIQEMMNMAMSDGVQGTPAVFINDKFVSGAYPYDYFAMIIDNELVK
jgi:protein-disulfide isomerase